jgi:major intracellular serine protease
MLEVSQQLGYNIEAFHFNEIWKKTQGEGTVIALIDSGVDMSHEDLKDNIIAGPNFIAPGRLPDFDGCQHGTLCTGLIVAESNEIGMVGVAPKAKVLVIKALDKNGMGDLQTVAKAVRWAVDNGNADIISLSLGCPNETREIYKAILYAYSKNVPVFCASGNSGNLNNIFYPANYQETISVSAVNQNMQRANFANVSPNINFFAFGTDLYSTTYQNSYSKISGTSAATPLLAGYAALLLSYKRNHQTDMKLDTVEDYKNALKQYCRPIKDTCAQGFGFFDPDVFLEQISKN